MRASVSACSPAQLMTCLASNDSRCVVSCTDGPRLVDLLDLLNQPHLHAAPFELIFECVAYAHVVGDAGVGRPQPGDAGRMRFDFFELRRVDPFDAGHAVGRGAPMQLAELFEFTLMRGHDDLAAALVGDAVRLAEVIHARGAVHAQLRLERAGFVVDAGVDDTAVVPGLMRGNKRLFFKHAIESSGLRAAIARAVASPTMPPPMINRSCIDYMKVYGECAPENGSDT